MLGSPLSSSESETKPIKLNCIDLSRQTHQQAWCISGLTAAHCVGCTDDASAIAARSRSISLSKLSVVDPLLKIHAVHRMPVVQGLVVTTVACRRSSGLQGQGSPLHVPAYQREGSPAQAALAKSMGPTQTSWKQVWPWYTSPQHDWQQLSPCTA